MSGKKRIKRIQAGNDSEEARLSKEPRLGPLVADLRHDEKFSDAEIRVGDEVFPVHRNVVCALSEFFMKSFSGPFKEAQKRSLTIEEASLSVVSILLDFAYGIDVSSKMKDELDLACEVVSLSHRFDVKKLIEVAAVGACFQLATDNCIRLFRLFKTLDCSLHSTVFLFIVQHLEEVSSSPDF